MQQPRAEPVYPWDSLSLLTGGCPRLHRAHRPRLGSGNRRRFRDRGRSYRRWLGNDRASSLLRHAELAEAGYWLRREARGQGAATTAVRLVSGWAFTKLGIRRLNLLTAPENAASQRVAERAGFTREGLLRAWLPTSGGRRVSVMYSLLPGDPPAKP